MGWLGIVAMLGNVLAGALFMAPAKPVAVVDDVLGPLVLCTQHGPQLALSSDNAPVGGQDQPGGKNGHCTACMLLAGVPIAIALVVAPITFPERIFRPLQSRARTLADHLSLGGVRSRAPPQPA